MSYQVLARKWRPRRFQEMVGQEHVLKALVNALDDDRLHHAYLFTGTRGVGKTSIARLFAKSLNCEQGISSEPCGQCTACREIAEGRFVDLIEVDAASRTKVEDTRELLENVQYAPTHGRFKVYLIDEVHMLSSHSFNALLKTLEEPPPHVKFLLATTDPQKLPVTILSRCLQFNLKNLVPERIVSHLQHVLGEEQISFEEPALWLLARSADGSMRDALSLTDQAIAFGAGSVSENDVRAMLGTIDQRLVYRILDAVASHNGADVLAASAELAGFSPDYASVLGELISLLHRVALAQVVPEAVDNSLGDLEQVRELASRMRAEDVQLYYQIAVMGRKDLPFVPHAREGLEMILLRMLAFRPAGAAVSSVQAPSTQTIPSQAPSTLSSSTASSSTQEPLVQSVEKPASDTADNGAGRTEQSPQPSAPAADPSGAAERQTAVETRSDPVTASPAPAPVPPPAPPVPQRPPQPAQPSPPVMEEPPLMDEPPPWDEYDVATAGESAPLKKPEAPAAPLEAVAAPAVEPSAEQVTHNEPVSTPVESVATRAALYGSVPFGETYQPVPSNLEELAPEHWIALESELGLTGMTDSLARALSLEQVSSTLLCFHYSAEQDALLNATQRSRIADALNQRLGMQLQIEYREAVQTRETPAQYSVRRRLERKAEAVVALQQDPLVRQIIEQFGAHIEEESVTPLDPS